MRRSYIIGILWGLLMCSLLGMVFCINKYINNKRWRLRTEIRENIKNIFEGQYGGDGFVGNDDGFFDEVYSGNPVRHYKKTSIPRRPRNSLLSSAKELDKDEKAILKRINEQIDDEWQQNYGDLYSLYELNWGDEYPNENDEGWNIVRIYCGGPDDDFIQTNIIFPYKVGLKNTDWGNYYTVEQAVNEAFVFYTTNPKSNFSERFKKGSNNHLWTCINDCENEYYGVSNWY